jgi:hypothetical protein
MAKDDGFIDHLATLPATNFTIFIGQGLAVLFIVFDLTGIATGWVTDANQSFLYLPAGFIAAMLGLGVTQFGIKRATFDPATLGMKREDVDPSPPAPAAVIVNKLPGSLPVGQTAVDATRTLPDAVSTVTADPEPRNRQDERG